MKKIILSALLLAGAMSSCSKNEVTEVLPVSDNANSIGLELVASASRAQESAASDIREAANVVIDYYVYDEGDGNITSDFYEGASGELTFDYINGTWYQTAETPTLWSELLGESLDGAFYTYAMVLGELDDDDTTPAVVDLELGDGTDANASIGEYVTVAEFTPKTTIADQYDVLYHAGDISTLPTTGKISATFNHALSRIELYALTQNTTSISYTPYVKTIALVGFKDSGTANIYQSTDAANANITAQINAYTTISNATLSDYTYSPKGTHNIAWTAGTDYTYYSWFDKTGDVTASDGSIYAITGQNLVNNKIIRDLGSSTATAVQFVSADDTDAIIIPQIIESSHEDFVDYFSLENNSTVPTNFYGLNDGGNKDDSFYVNTYKSFADKVADGSIYYYNLNYPAVYALYRMTETNGSTSSVVGYTDFIVSSEYQMMLDPENEVYQPVYPDSIFTARDQTGAIDTYTINPRYSAGGSQNAALYVLVAFPFSSWNGTDDISVIFEPGYDYDLFVGFGTTGGILLCDYYFFGDGTMTNIPIDGIDPGDTVLTTGDSEVGLTVSSKTWTDYDGDDNIDGGDENAYLGNELLD